LRPDVPLKVLTKLRELGIIPTSMIDVSDGLSSELLHICRQSDCGVVIYQDKIPVTTDVANVSAEFEMEPLIPALNGGEDYEMLFTVPLSDHDKVAGIEGVSIIGNITEHKGTAILMTNEGNGIALQAQGWQAFYR